MNKLQEKIETLPQIKYIGLDGEPSGYYVPIKMVLALLATEVSPAEPTVGDAFRATKVDTTDRFAAPASEGPKSAPVNVAYSMSLNLPAPAIQQAVDAERERCAKLAENPYGDEVALIGEQSPLKCGAAIAAAIRGTSKLHRTAALLAENGKPHDEIGWLVERNLPESGHAEWLSSWCGKWEWTTDAYKAIRFCRRQDALRVTEIFKSDNAFMTEHLWNAPTQGAENGKEEE